MHLGGFLISGPLILLGSFILFSLFIKLHLDIPYACAHLMKLNLVCSCAIAQSRRPKQCKRRKKLVPPRQEQRRRQQVLVDKDSRCSQAEPEEGRDYHVVVQGVHTCQSQVAKKRHNQHVECFGCKDLLLEALASICVKVSELLGIQLEVHGFQTDQSGRPHLQKKDSIDQITKVYQSLLTTKPTWHNTVKKIEKLLV